jgi:hypothetical protein
MAVLNEHASHPIVESHPRDVEGNHDLSSLISLRQW